MYAAMYEMRKLALTELLEDWAINPDEYREIEDWFKEQGIEL